MIYVKPRKARLVKERWHALKNVSLSCNRIGGIGGIARTALVLNRIWK